jgi:uncharacterized protein YdaU (DUF1376 family)
MADKRPPFFAFYPADFANDIHVEAMSTLQVGAYMLLLCKAWQAEPPASLPNDDQILARLARLDPEVWAEVKAAVLVPFRLGTDGRLHSKRLRLEYDRALERMKVNRGRASDAARRRWGMPQACSKHAPSNAPSMPQAMLKQCSSNAIEKEKEKKKKDKKKTPSESPHSRAVALYCDAWQAKYGERYPFAGGKDGEAVKAILAHLAGDVDKFGAVVARYLADGDPFLAGHTLGMLRSQLAKWLIDKPAGAAGRAPPHLDHAAKQELRIMSQIAEGLRGA